MAEKEYIEREAVYKVISKEVNVQRLSYLPRKLELEGLKTVMNQVNKIPAADVVEVVRCKDCIKRNTANCAMWFNCMKCGGQWSWESDNGFCSLGERRKQTWAESH